MKKQSKQSKQPSLMGIRIREQRLLNGLSQKELADKLGVNHSAIYKYESGIVQNPSKASLVKMAKIFGCSYGYLLGESENSVSAQTNNFPFMAELAFTCPDNSMINHRIAKGDTVFVKSSAEPFDGAIVAFKNTTGHTMIRRYFVKEGFRNSATVILLADNPHCDPVFISKSNFRYVGLVVGFQSKV